jgi:hypothetical protein
LSLLLLLSVLLLFSSVIAGLPHLSGLTQLPEYRAELIDLSTIRRPISSTLRRDCAVVVLLRLAKDIGGDRCRIGRRCRSGR